MEDDDSDTSLTIDESVPAEKTNHSTTALNDTASECTNSPKQLDGENEIKQVGSDTVIKSLSSEDSAVTQNNKSGDKNVDVLVSDTEIPKIPKKVNGEVKLSKCENNEQEPSHNVVERDKIQDKDTENTKNNTKDKHVNSLDGKSAKDDGQNSESNVEYKGFKKKIIAQQSLASNSISDNVKTYGTASKLNTKSKKPPFKKNVANESQCVLVSHQPIADGTATQSSAQLTEYAQYLGLQPTVKFKCFKCGESGFPSMLKLHEHQNICLKNLNKMQTVLKPTPPPPPPESSPATNFRITRKVYLCSACGTYYENWNLFLHMREIHKRYICLFCLGMFSQADKLASHLVSKHGVTEGFYSSSEHFVSENKGSCYLMCCTCERIFTERENYYDHSCSEGLIINAEKACSLCGLRGAHFPTCRRAFTDSTSSPPSSSTVSTALENTTESVHNSTQERNASASKYVGSVNKVPGKKCNKTNDLHESVVENQEKTRDLSDIDDDYDISNAASFCHVNIHEPQEKQTTETVPKVKTYRNKNQVDVSKRSIIEKEPSESSSTGINEDESKEKDVVFNETAQDKMDIEKNKKTIDVIAEKIDKEGEEEEKKEEEEEKEEENDKKEEKIKSSNEDKISDSVQETEKESNEADIEDKIELEKEEASENQTKESTDPAFEEVECKPESQEETNSKEAPEPSMESVEKFSPNRDSSPKESPQTETKQTVKTTSATDAESESESSDSGEESESSSSSDVSSEESEHREIKNEEKIEDSDVDNADSDKMSLVVDENRSDEETELKSEEINTKEKGLLKETEDVDMKLDEPKSDAETADIVVDETEENKSVNEEKVEESGESIQLAGDDVPLLELTLEENLETMNIQMLLKESVKVSCINCVYCNHAKRIAVNGKQLALHLLAEHRFAPVVCSDSGELTEADGFMDKLKNSLSELQHMYFNTDSYDNMDPDFMRPYDKTYECFHCHFVTTLHKELYVHNRKMHQKTILLCIMCKSNFYSYSELLCHLCPGIYVPESNITFHCCLCTVDGLPSAFRLMVHLRKRHNACDVCLETTGDQQKLSNHVWKHKLHHLCYRCGIAYRNKPDITKHLFWKHGTESVLCKKCLQKKWPHVYHFCIPPNAFVCDECNLTFSRAVQLKVHKRLHAGDLLYPCNDCEERFISRKLLMKHQDKHREPPIQIFADTNIQENGCVGETQNHDEVSKSNHEGEKGVEQNTGNVSDSTGKREVHHEDDVTLVTPTSEKTKDEIISQSVPEGENSKQEEREVNEKKTKVLDVYDLPPLNLSSESDDSDEEMEKKESQVGNMSEESPVDKQVVNTEDTKQKTEDKIPQNEPQPDDIDIQQPVEIVDGIWENFKNYKANLERRENQQIGETALKINDSLEQTCNRLSAEVISIINLEHDYCGPTSGTSHLSEEQSECTSKLEGEALLHALSPLPDAEKTEDIKDKTDDELKACDADHNYCFTNASVSADSEKEKEPTSEIIPSAISPSKKKQKSPKKKQKRSASSSSSDSSSNSDSSSCSCGTNCSCSSSSSSSSGSSSSQSSDSDSSSSEGRRRQAARRERRRERARKRKLEESEEGQQLLPPSKSPKLSEAVESTPNGPPEAEKVEPMPTLIEPEETELQIRESDLETDETDTDEDFYDKYPQRLANKLLAEKRNQLLLLAAVAPVNNGSMSQSCQSPPPSSIEEPVPKKKVKTKKHKKSQHQHNSTENKVESNVKLNIPTDYYSAQSPAFSKSSSSTSNSINTVSLATPAHNTQSPFHSSHPEPVTPTAYQSTGSGSETDNTKRLSKRKRVPKRFYGDSSDEEHDQPVMKWRKVSTTASNSPAPPAVPFTYKSTPITETFCNPSTPVPANEDKSDEDVADDSDSDHEDAKKSSSSSSNSESEAEKDQDDDDPSDSDIETSAVVQTNTLSASREGHAVQQKNENLYCYCQCPYDEVSEMIACDGKDCTIEWFHFECVGIMVPPKGKWFCPDCRKRAAARSEYLLHE